MRRRELEACVRERFGLDLHDFIRQKVNDDALYDYEIASILGVSRGRIGSLRRQLGITKKDGFSARFERKHGKGSVSLFKNLIEDPAKSLADVGIQFGFSREYARQAYREIYGCPYTVAYKRKREKRERKRAECLKRKQLKRISDMRDMSDMRQVCGQRSIEHMMEPRFKGIRGINCRFRIDEANPIRREIRQAIWQRFEGNKEPVYRPESINATETGALEDMGSNGR